MRMRYNEEEANLFEQNIWTHDTTTIVPMTFARVAKYDLIVATNFSSRVLPNGVATRNTVSTKELSEINA